MIKGRIHKYKDKVKSNFSLFYFYQDKNTILHIKPNQTDTYSYPTSTWRTNPIAQSEFNFPTEAEGAWNFSRLVMNSIRQDLYFSKLQFIISW